MFHVALMTQSMDSMMQQQVVKTDVRHSVLSVILCV